MPLKPLVLAACCLSCLSSASAADEDPLVAAADAPLYKLSNLRTDTDQFGNQTILVDFVRTRKGQGAVGLRGRSQRGFVSISAYVSPSVDSGTMQLKSFLPTRGQKWDIELFFSQTHKLAGGQTRYSMVSNAVRLGDPGPPVAPRPWTAEEFKGYEEYKRVMSDPTAQKPIKKYEVTADVPEGSQLVPKEARIGPGTPLQACFQSKWSPLTALSENADGTINVRWDAYGPKYDCSMTRDELTIDNELLVKGADGSLTTLPRAEVEERGLLPAKPRKSYPVSIAVPDDSQPVPKDLTVRAGTKLQACYSGKWNPITALSQNKDGSLNVRWDDYGPTFDCSMLREELIIKKSEARRLRALMSARTPSPSPSTAPLTPSATSVASAASTPPAPVARTWTDSTGQHKIKARLVRKTETSVTLLTDAGRELTLPLEKLSTADRKFLKTAPATGN